MFSAVRVRTRCWLYLSLLVSFFLIEKSAGAWVFPEHVEITGRAVRELETNGSLAQRQVLSTVKRSLGLCAEDLWSHCPTLASMVALAGDHSCTPHALRSMLAVAKADEEHWVRSVLQVAARTQKDLRSADRDVAKREDVRRQMHVDLQLADPEYLARALLDYSHFQHTRDSGSTADLRHYLGIALAPGARANATASYANYHVVAVRLASMARTAPSSRERDAWLARAFSAEAFALHFLEDAFSSGHFVGHWGDDATRLGTHDYYSRTGLEAVRWRAPSEPFVAHGDAFLSDVEADSVAVAVRASLVQVLQATTVEAVAASLLSDFHDALGEEGYDSCARGQIPLGLSALERSQAIQEVVAFEPVPAPRLPALARVRAEKGFFLGGAATAAASYAARPETAGVEIRATMRLGFGAAAIVDDPLNAQAFFEAGFVGQYSSSAGSGASRTGYSFRIRAPGYLFLVDGAVAIILADSLKAKCPFCLRWGAAAAGGGLGRLWSSHPLFGSVSWQLSALRDVSFNWFRNEPGAGQGRYELLFSLLAARSVLPIAGERLSQSTDFYLDIGPSVTFASGERTAYGAFASFAMATRVFP